MTGSDVRKKILVVEDEPLVRSLCARVLTNEGFEISVAVDGKTAEQMLDERRYDLCLVDIRTPVINGKELYHYILEKHPYLARGIIFTTGDIIGGETQSFLKETDRPYILKPFAPEDLRSIIKETLQALTGLV
jgi:CheY-like chemotaxis protein